MHFPANYKKTPLPSPPPAHPLGGDCPAPSWSGRPPLPDLAPHPESHVFHPKASRLQSQSLSGLQALQSPGLPALDGSSDLILRPSHPNLKNYAKKITAQIVNSPSLFCTVNSLFKADEVQTPVPFLTPMVLYISPSVSYTRTQVRTAGPNWPSPESCFLKSLRKAVTKPTLIKAKLKNLKEIVEHKVFFFFSARSCLHIWTKRCQTEYIDTIKLPMHQPRARRPISACTENADRPGISQFFVPEA
jgi:hypothetical protein